MKSDVPQRHRTALWVGVTGVSQAWKFLISIASSAVLARLLRPTDFGLVATISPLIAFADLIRDLGFSQAVVQRKTLDQNHVNSLFWMSVGLTLILSCVLTAVSPLVARFFGDSRLTSLTIAAGWILLLGTLSALPMALLNRQLKFGVIAVIEAAAATIGLIIAVSVAWTTHSYWALLMSGVAYSVVAAASAQLLSGWRPGRPRFDREVREMARFGAGVSTANIATFFSRNADNLLIARVNGLAALGLYDRAYKLMLLPLSQVTWPVARVMVPVLTRLSDDAKAYRTSYLDCISYLMIASQPGFLLCILQSRPVIHLVLGPKWDGVAPIFSWLGAAALQQLATSSLGWLFLSQGRARGYATMSIVSSAITVTSFIIGLPWGPVGVAASYMIADTFLRMPVSAWLVTRRGPIRMRDLRSLLIPHGAALIVSGLVVLACARFLTGGLLGLSLEAFVAYLAYGLMLLPWSNRRRLLLNVISKCAQFLQIRWSGVIARRIRRRTSSS